MSTIEEVGEEIGHRLALLCAGGGVVRSVASRLIGAVFEAYPSVKLPMLLADPQTKAWMIEAGVTEHHLRDALAEKRRKRRAADAEAPEEKTSTKRRKVAPIVLPATVGTVLPPARTGDLLASGMVPNRSISDL